MTEPNAPSELASEAVEPLVPSDTRPRSAFSLWRRRLSPLVILFAIFVLGRESCAKKDNAPVVVKISVSQFTRDVSMLRGELRRGDNVVTSFERHAVAGSMGTIELKIPGGDSAGSAHLEVFVQNKLIEIDRNFQAPPGSTVTIDVSDELLRRLAPP